MKKFSPSKLFGVLVLPGSASCRSPLSVGGGQAASEKMSRPIVLRKSQLGRSIVFRKALTKQPKFCIFCVLHHKICFFEKIPVFSQKRFKIDVALFSKVNYTPSTIVIF